MAALQQRWQQARRRRWWSTLLLALPLALGATAVALRLGGFDIATVVLLVALLAGVALATWRSRQLDRRWLVRQLDRHAPLQDSADLLFAPDDALNPLQHRQRAHVHATLQTQTPDLRTAWPRRALLAAWLGALVVIALALGWPRTSGGTARPSPVTAPLATPAQPPRLQSSRLAINTPAYTGQPARVQSTLDAKVAQGSALQWSLRFSAQPREAVLQFHDGRRVALRREGDSWTGTWTADRPALYRVVTVPALAGPRLYRLDVLPDQPPRVRVLAPDRTLVLGMPGQRQWALQFEATDDHGVAADAQLKITLAQGSGENITFREHTLTLAGSGTPTLRRFARTLDLAALGAESGNDVIAQLQVRDNRAPAPQTAQSTSVILRLPSVEQVQGAELEGMVKKTLPAYFRSQRQIIIDAEALIKLRRQLPAEEFIKRADAIGVDQRILRLRYGQFLGEESEGGAKPPPTSDALPTSDTPTADAHNDTDAHAHAQAEKSDHAQAGHDGHDHAGATPEAPPVFGSATDVLSEYG
ncbi:MAG: hypothetical protein RR698_10875, partial [Stenotrophomonas sp.]